MKKYQYKFFSVNGIKERWDNSKFGLAVKSIFIFAVVVSFSHTIELYGSVGFDEPVVWMNNLVGVDFITLALFATLAAEAAFAVGLWGLYEAYDQIKKFPRPTEYWHIWSLFGGGLVVVGWSNIGGAVGYDFLIGQPYKGIALALSIPSFVLGSVLVMFKRQPPAANQETASQETKQPESNQQPVKEQRGWLKNVKEQTSRPDADDRKEKLQPGQQPTAIHEDGQPKDIPAKEQPHPATAIQEAAASQEAKQPKDSTTTKQSESNQQPDKQRPVTIRQGTTANQEEQPANNKAKRQPTANQGATKKQPAKVTTIKPVADEKIIEVAEKYLADHGELPSQRKLAKLAETTRHRATKALEQLKMEKAI